MNYNMNKIVYVTRWGDASDSNRGHGSHVVGTILGSVESDVNRCVAAWSGMAPESKVLLRRIV